MKYLSRLSLSLIFICILSAAGFAGETGTPPCTPGETGTPPCACATGQTNTPPCSSQSVIDAPVVPGETLSPPAAPAVDITAITEAVIWALSLF
jgi:hypothetical protein